MNCAPAQSTLSSARSPPSSLPWTSSEPAESPSPSSSCRSARCLATRLSSLALSPRRCCRPWYVGKPPPRVARKLRDRVHPPARLQWKAQEAAAAAEGAALEYKRMPTLLQGGAWAGKAGGGGASQPPGPGQARTLAPPSSQTGSTSSSARSLQGERGRRPPPRLPGRASLAPPLPRLPTRRPTLHRSWRGRGPLQPGAPRAPQRPLMRGGVGAAAAAAAWGGHPRRAVRAPSLRPASGKTKRAAAMRGGRRLRL